MKVKALKVGYYAHKRYKEGEEIILKPVKVKVEDKIQIISAADQFSQKWMELIDEDFNEDGDSEEIQAQSQPSSSVKMAKPGKPKGKSSAAAESEPPKMSA